MLWQPSLPDSYTKMAPADLAAAIARRKAELGDQLVILGHHYQTDEIIQHADYTGDSLKLSQTAARLAEGKSPVKFVIFCGVHFMAETADMLTPDSVAVILPDLSAGCSMADMAQYDDTVQAWESIHETLKDQGWRGVIVPITYVNSSAAIKAFVGEHGGACCTSSNAAAVFEWAMSRAATVRERISPPSTSAPAWSGAAPLPDGRDSVKVLFLPDQHLGRNTANHYGIDVATQTCVYDPRLARKGETLGGATPEQVLASKAILWAGHCSVHKLFRPEHCEQVRAADREREKNAPPEDGAVAPTKILVHPECCIEVVDKSDLSGSTEFIINTIAQAQPGSRWAVGTEVHLVKRIAAQAAARGVHVQILSDCQCLCTTMYRIDQPHLLWVLDNLAAKSDGRLKDGKPKVVNQISVKPRVRELALIALERMLSLTGKPKAEALATAD